MGYHSQVIFWVESPVVSKLLTVLSQNKEGFNLLFSHAEKEKNEKGDIRFVLDYVKWYSGYGSVDCIEDFMDDLDTDDKEALYGFHRLGEEYGDHVMRGHSEAWEVYPTQSMEFS